MWGFLVFIMFVVMFLYLMVCIDPHGDGILAKIRKFFFDSLPGFLKKWGIRLCGKTIVIYIEKSFNY
jgi:hypothetical protein